MQTIRRAAENDIPAVAAIYDRVLIREERGETSIGWKRGIYPTADTAREALAAGELFVMERGGAIVAAARINQTQVPEYAAAAWTITDVTPDEVMVLHTLVVDPLCAGAGLGTAFVRFYEQYAAVAGCRALRMDTNVRNAAARRLYGHLGYREVGVVPCVFNGIEGVSLVCLEKAVTPQE